MTFQIDTGETVTIIPKSASVEEGQTLRFCDGVRAERTHRQIIENIEAHDDPDDLTKYVRDEGPVIDALSFNYPEYAAAIEDAFEDHLTVLRAGLAAMANANPAQPGNTGAPVTAQSAKSEKEF